MDSKTKSGQMKRRTFLAGAAAAGAGAMLTSGVRRARAQAKPADVNVGIIGTGTQGMVLLRDALRIPGVKFRAVCDIWDFSLRYSSGTVRKFVKNPVNPQPGAPNQYKDYKEMLAKEKDLDACIVATPDWMHAEHAIAAMKAGLHVYCEKEMSKTLSLAKDMAVASKETGKMLQIGHQRRSNPVYLWALKMIQEDKLLGKFRSCHGQWNRAASEKRNWHPRYVIPEAELKKHGYESMDQFRNWRWFKKYSSGPIADLGSHQIDIFSWYVGVEPHSVQAVGGDDYWPDREWYEDVMCLYEYKPKAGPSVRGFYQVQSTNGFGHYYERFMGDKGTITMSEDHRKCTFVPERGTPVPAWMENVQTVDIGGTQAYPLIECIKAKGPQGVKDMEVWKVTNIHQFHLMNFFNAVRANDPKKLSCPPSVGYPTAVAVLNVIPAIEKGTKLELDEKAYEI